MVEVERWLPQGSGRVARRESGGIPEVERQLAGSGRGDPAPTVLLLGAGGGDCNEPQGKSISQTLRLTGLKTFKPGVAFHEFI